MPAVRDHDRVRPQRLEDFRRLRAQLFDVAPGAIEYRQRQRGPLVVGHTHEPHPCAAVALGTQLPHLASWLCLDAWLRQVRNERGGIRPPGHGAGIRDERERPAVRAHIEVDLLALLPRDRHADAAKLHDHPVYKQLRANLGCGVRIGLRREVAGGTRYREHPEHDACHQSPPRSGAHPPGGYRRITWHADGCALCGLHCPCAPGANAPLRLPRQNAAEANRSQRQPLISPAL